MSTSTRDKLLQGLAKRDKSMLADPHLSRIGNSVRKTSSVVSREKIFEIPVKLIKENPFQYREEESLNNSELKSLAESIEQHGLRSPIQLRKDGDNYLLVAGWRRLTAIKRFLTNIENVKATVDSQMNDKTHRMLTIIENEQREDFTAFEKARAYNDMQKMDGFTLEQIAETVGSSKTRISRILKLITLPESIQSQLREGILKGVSAGHLDELVNGYKKREKKGVDHKDISQWISEVTTAVLDGETTIEHIRESNREIIKSDKPSKKQLKRYVIKGEGWNKFEVSTKNKVTLEFKLPENYEYNNSEKIIQYLQEQLQKQLENQSE